MRNRQSGLEALPIASHKPEVIVTKLRQVELLTAQGRSVAEAIRSIGVTEATFNRLRQESAA